MYKYNELNCLPRDYSFPQYKMTNSLPKFWLTLHMSHFEVKTSLREKSLYFSSLMKYNFPISHNICISFLHYLHHTVCI